MHEQEWWERLAFVRARREPAELAAAQPPAFRLQAWLLTGYLEYLLHSRALTYNFWTTAAS